MPWFVTPHFFRQLAKSLPSRSPALWTTSCCLAGICSRIEGYCIPILEILVPRVCYPIFNTYIVIHTIYYWSARLVTSAKCQPLLKHLFTFVYSIKVPPLCPSLDHGNLDRLGKSLVQWGVLWVIPISLAFIGKRPSRDLVDIEVGASFETQRTWDNVGKI